MAYNLKSRTGRVAFRRAARSQGVSAARIMQTLHEHDRKATKKDKFGKMPSREKIPSTTEPMLKSVKWTLQSDKPKTHETQKMADHLNESFKTSFGQDHVKGLAAHMEKIKMHAASKSSGTGGHDQKAGSDHAKGGGGADDYNRDEQGRFAPK